jgi:hypothetical protein
MGKNFKDTEHFALAVIGIVGIILCCKFGHGEVADAIALICIGSSGSSAARQIFCSSSSKEIVKKEVKEVKEE